MKRSLALMLAVVALEAGAAGDASLIDAVKSQRRAAALELIEGGADVNAREPDSTTPLIWAAYYGDTVLVDKLLAAGADVTVQNDYGATAMSEAATIGATPVIEMLLNAGADPDSANPEGETALMLVARTGNLEAAKLLLDAGADVDAKEGWGGQSALMWAAAQLQPAMVELLAARGADVDARSAVREWGRRITAEPRPKDLHIGGLTPLLYAARGGCIECAQHLSAAGADIDLADPEGVTPLIMAILNYHFDLADDLVDAGADVDKWDLWGRTPLYAAIDMNTLPLPGQPGRPSGAGLALAAKLLAAGANPNPQLKQWRPPFRNAIGERGSDNTLTTGATPLLRAAHASDNAAIELLLAHGAIVDLPNAAGITPLLAAAGVGLSPRSNRARFKTEAAAVESVKRLLAAGADVKARTHDGRRVNRERQGIRQIVFPASYRFANVPPDDRTAVHGAARNGWNDVIHLLVEHGAEINVVDGDGKTPLDLAMGRYEPAPSIPPPDPHRETVALLEDLIRKETNR